MKKIISIIISLIASTLICADTGFRWASSSGAAEDRNGTAFASNEATVFTVLDFDLTTAPSYQAHSTVAGAFQIDISDIPSFIDDQNIAVAPFGSLPRPWEVASNITDSGIGRVGSVAYAVVADGGGLTSIGLNDWIGQAAGDFATGTYADNYELNNISSGPTPGISQSFNPGIVVTNIQVIPEPSTFFLLGIAGLGLYGTRRFARK